MSDPQESITITTRRDGDTSVVVVSGELDLHSSGDLGAAITRALDGSPSSVAIEAQGLTFADSAGLRALLLARNQAGESGIPLRLTKVSDPLDRLLEMTGLREILGAPVT